MNFTLCLSILIIIITVVLLICNKENLANSKENFGNNIENFGNSKENLANNKIHKNYFETIETKDNGKEPVNVPGWDSGFHNYAYMGRCQNIPDKKHKQHSCNQTDKTLNQQDIINMYNDLTFSQDSENPGNNEEQLPNGGLLISMFDNNYACNGPEYKTVIENGNVNENGNNNYCVSVDKCEGFDFKDIKSIMNKNTLASGTSCYALDVSYMRADFPSVLFGPLVAEVIDMNIGLIIDINKLKKYSACMYLSDVGSNGRYNRIFEKGYNKKRKGYMPVEDIGPIEPSNITDKEITTDYNNLLHSKRGRQLAQAGCGLQYNFQGPGLSGIFNNKELPTHKINTYRGADKVLINDYNNENNPNTLERIYKGEYIINSLPLKRSSWSNFIYRLKEKTRIIKELGGNEKLWKNHMLNYNSNILSNIFIENEVDIFVPNKPLKDGGSNCDPTDEFKEVWKDAVIGIFTNNRCFKEIKYNKVCNDCKKLQSYDCGGKDICCCNKNFNEELVKKLVLKFNQNSNNIINGYIMNDNLNPSLDFPKPNPNTGLFDLQIQQLTHYKSYFNVPIIVQNEEYYNQYFYNVKCDGICGIDNSKERTVGIAIPKLNENDEKIKQNLGKYIICFSYIRGTNNFIFCNDGKSIETTDGLINSKYLENSCKNNNGVIQILKYYQDYLHNMIKLGYTIITFSDCDWDTLSFSPGKDTSKQKGKCSGYWNDGNNSDVRYFQSVFKDLYCNNFIDENQNQIKVNYNDLCLVGYSVGAQMVSRCFNNFPLMYTAKNNTGQSFKFPQIKCGILIAGGSYFCYSDESYTDKYQLKHCIDPDNRGCCMIGKTEENYDDDKFIDGIQFSWFNHPYTFLVQSENDGDSDPQAAQKYYNAVPEIYRGEYISAKQDNKDTKLRFNRDKRVYCEYSKGDIHGLSNIQQVNNMTKFTEYYL